MHVYHANVRESVVIFMARAVFVVKKEDIELF